MTLKLATVDGDRVAQLTAEIAAIDEHLARLHKDNPDLAPPVPDPFSDGKQPERKIRAQHIADLMANPTKPRWLIRDELERGVIALIAGPRGSYKSFLALHWAMQVAVFDNLPVYIVSAEGSDIDRRVNAWLKAFAPNKRPGEIPLVAVQKRVSLIEKQNIEDLRADCLELGIRPVLFVLDTFSKLSGTLDENSNTDVKEFIGKLDNGLKRAFDATVLLVAHTGHGEKTRARGASALEADTDAAYIVSSRVKGQISVTRERFKASPELDPLAFGAEIIQLGYTDDDGRPVTSVILRESEKAVRETRKRPGGQQGEVLKMAGNHAAIDPIEVDSLIDLVIDATPRGNSTVSQRKANVLRSVCKLVETGWLHMHPGDRVCLTSAVGGEL